MRDFSRIAWHCELRMLPKFLLSTRKIIIAKLAFLDDEHFYSIRRVKQGKNEDMKKRNWDTTWQPFDYSIGKKNRGRKPIVFRSVEDDWGWWLGMMIEDDDDDEIEECKTMLKRGGKWRLWKTGRKRKLIAGASSREKREGEEKRRANAPLRSRYMRRSSSCKQPVRWIKTNENTAAHGNEPNRTDSDMKQMTTGTLGNLIPWSVNEGGFRE